MQRQLGEEPGRCVGVGRDADQDERRAGASQTQQHLSGRIGTTWNQLGARGIEQEREEPRREQPRQLEDDLRLADHDLREGGVKGRFRLDELARPWLAGQGDMQRRQCSH